jgi:hypothetical protein
MGAVKKAASIVVGIFLINKNSNEPKGFYHPLFRNLNIAILAAISVLPIASAYCDLDLSILLKFSI